MNFAEFTLDLANGELWRGGAAVPLQPQPMKVLVLLAARAGDVVTRQELQQAVWGSETFVDFDQGLNWCIRRIREVLGDDAAQPRFIQTLPRKGYRFLAEAVRKPEAPRGHRWLTVAALAVVCFVATSVLRGAGAVTVVVLPFDNDTGDARCDVVAASTTEEIINRVGGVDPERLKVIDPMTAAKFKRRNECIIHIGQELGAQYVVEGAVQPGHTTAALYRVADNTQVWATAQTRDQAPRTIAGKISSTFNRP